MSWPDPLDELFPDGHITKPPSARPTLRDGDIECCACGTHQEEDTAYTFGWRTVTSTGDEILWQCPGCARVDVER